MQNSHQFAHNEPHTGVCGSVCEFENVLFSKENRTHKSHTFAHCEQNDHAYSLGAAEHAYYCQGEPSEGKSPSPLCWWDQQEEEGCLCLQEGKGKKQVKVTLTREDGDDKGTCFHYGVKGHWKRNYKKYLDEKAQWKHDDAPGIYMIDTCLIEIIHLGY